VERKEILMNNRNESTEILARALEGLKQYIQMAVYWGEASRALQAQVKTLLEERAKLGLLELIEVPNEDMGEMRKFLISGTPVYFSRYPDGVLRMYPVPEE
jgi:hypothetical protein